MGLPQRGGSEGVDAWDLVYRPRAIRRICAIVALVVIAIHVIFGLLLNVSYTGVSVGWSDKISLIVIGLVIAVVVCLPVRATLRVGAAGVSVTNLGGTRLFGWDQVVGLAYPEKGAWAQLLLPGDEHIPVLAVQARDGDLAVTVMQDFRDLRQRYAATPA